MYELHECLYIVLIARSTVLFAALRNVGPTLRPKHRHAKTCFIPAFTLVGLFVCYFGVKQHAHRSESQNNSAVLATSYLRVFDGVSGNLVYKPCDRSVIIISSFEIFLLLSTG
jgi:hypothetical protein